MKTTVGLKTNPHSALLYIKSDDDLAAYVLEHVLEERERCAKIAESREGLTDYDLGPEAAVSESVTANGIAAAIRKGEA